MVMGSREEGDLWGLSFSPTMTRETREEVMIRASRKLPERVT